MAKRAKTKLFVWQERAKEGGECAVCHHRVPRLTVDHIVPVSICEMLDATERSIYEDERNFQMLCVVCNKYKGNKIDKKHPMTKVVLLELLG
jgi:5-methylcytosine-specific restriction endonuclease McrA